MSQDGDYRPMSTFLANLHGMYVMSHAQEGALRKSGHSCSIDRRRDFSQNSGWLLQSSSEIIVYFKEHAQFSSNISYHFIDFCRNHGKSQIIPGRHYILMVSAEFSRKPRELSRYAVIVRHCVLIASCAIVHNTIVEIQSYNIYSSYHMKSYSNK